MQDGTEGTDTEHERGSQPTEGRNGLAMPGLSDGLEPGGAIVRLLKAVQVTINLMEEQMAEIEIPKGGAYFATETGRFHISVVGDNVNIRCVDLGSRGTPRLFTHQPAGNVVLVQAEPEL